MILCQNGRRRLASGNADTLLCFQVGAGYVPGPLQGQGNILPGRRSLSSHLLDRQGEREGCLER